jgi:anti-anti-sigma factor
MAGRHAVVNPTSARERVPSRSTAPTPLPVLNTTVIAPEGELDIAQMADFRAALSDATDGDAPRLVVDLSNVSFIDSSGLAALVQTHNRLRRGNRQLAVVAPEGTAVTVLINLAALQDRLAIFDTLEAAVRT